MVRMYLDVRIISGLLMMVSVSAFTQSPFQLDTISMKGSFGLVISSDGSEAFWAKAHEKKRSLIYTSRKTGRHWSAPEKAPFTTDFYQETMPFFSRDGKWLIFFSNRPAPGKANQTFKDLDFWMVKKEKSKWGEPQWGGSSVNTDSAEYFGSCFKDEIYFTSWKDGANGGIYLSTFKNGSFSTPIAVTELNNEFTNSSPAISTDGNTLIFYNVTNMTKGLSVSFRIDDKWTSPQLLGRKVNSDLFQFGPVFGTDGDTFFFTRGAVRVPGVPYDTGSYQIFSIPVTELGLKELRSRASNN